MPEDFDELFYDMIVDEGGDFVLMMLQNVFRFNSKFPMIDDEEIKMALKKMADFFMFNDSPVEIRLLELEREAEVLRKVLVAYDYALEN